jgi:hypothetical protein
MAIAEIRIGLHESTGDFLSVWIISCGDTVITAE